MKSQTFFIIFLLSSFSLRVFAQEATEEVPQGWPIVERCVGEAITSPDDWSFEGTILATGWAGIHGINAAYETPFVTAFANFPIFMPLSISPNGTWLAQVDASLYASMTSTSRQVVIHDVMVYSTNTSNEIYSSDYLRDIFSVPAGQIAFYAWKLNWWDENTLILDSNNGEAGMELVAWSFLNDEIYAIETENQGIFDISDAYSFISPDWSRYLDLNRVSFYSMGLYDVATGDALPHSRVMI